MQHTPVMIREVLEQLDVQNRVLVVDGTLGLGGHTEKILEVSGFTGRVIGIDRDEAHLSFARGRLSPFAERFFGVHSRFSEFDGVVSEPFDGFLLDLGVASPHLDNVERGFSFREESPLDMRMDQSCGLTAGEVVMSSSEEELADIFYHYGEERLARKIARWIVEDRRNGIVFLTTKQLADLVCRAYHKAYDKRSQSHPAAKVFQALRIFVNDELRELEVVLPKIVDRMRLGGRLVVISYHSLEDRIVKRYFKSDERLKVITKRPLVPSDAEIEQNPRARSAKMRVGIKV